MKYAIVFTRDTGGIITGHYIVAYTNFIAHVKAKGHKHDRYGYSSYESARQAANLALGTTGIDDVKNDKGN